MANKSKSRGNSDSSQQRPPQSQAGLPGSQALMDPPPCIIRESYRGSEKLKGKVAVISGGDSGIGQSTAVHFAQEGADVAILYLEETEDANYTQHLVEEAGQTALLIKGDLGDEKFCQQAIGQVMEQFGRIDILVNNAAEQHEQPSIEDITETQLERTYRTNLYGMFFLTKAALPHLKKQEGATIINTTSVTAYRGSPSLLDYASTKGAIVAYTRSLAQQVLQDGIRVNAVAPGPIWTPLIPASFDAEKVSQFGSNTPMGRAGQPNECATCYVFLASEDSSYMTGQVLHPNGGEIING
ncbi:Short-chain dehydrogenase [Planctomycetales bacterium 10988]|nr:Short-chain dehydrogenase [Planctomycetales bacterium 10988]